MNQEKIGKFIADLRKGKKLTQTELAKRIGVSNKTVSKWECGNAIPDYGVFENLCKEFNITVNELLNGEKDEKDDKVIGEYMKMKGKENRNKIIIVSIISFLIILCLILGIYFINSYNKINVYKISASNDNFVLSESSLVLSNQYTMFDMGKITTNLEDVEIIEAIYANEFNDKYYRIAVYEEGVIRSEKYGSEVEFARANIQYMPENMYLIIYYLKDDEYFTDVLKVNSDILITSDKLYYLKSDSIIVDSTDKIEEVTEVDLNEYAYVNDYKEYLIREGFKLKNGLECDTFQDGYCAILNKGNEFIEIDYINYSLSYEVRYDGYSLNNLAFDYKDEYAKNPVHLRYFENEDGEVGLCRVVWNYEKEETQFQGCESKRNLDKDLKRYIEILNKYNPLKEEK